MQYDLQDDVLVMRVDHSEDWRPVPVSLFKEAAEALAARNVRAHSINAHGRVTARIIRSA